MAYSGLHSLLVLAQIPAAHVIPEILDVEKFNVALGKALSSFPLLAGRPVRPTTPDAPWKVPLCLPPPPTDQN